MKRILLFLMLAGLLAGCDGPAASDPRMLLAEKCREEGDFAAAERQIRKYLDAHPESAETHLKLASLYDESLNDPVGAVYHYREFLRRAPGSPQKAEVEAWMRAARTRCAPPAPSGPAPEEERLARENASLRELAMRQQRELAELRRSAARPAAPAPAAAEVPAARPAPAPDSGPEFAEYEVRSGDSLGKIARRFYGSSLKIEPILKANGLTPRSILHIGQKLKIPQKTR